MLLGKKKETSVEIPSASLSDIVFLLLIFFLVTTAIDTEKGLDMILPPPSEDEILVNPKNLVKLLVNAEGKVSLDGEELQIREISGKLREMMFEAPNLIVSVKTMNQTKYDVYIDVMDQLKKAEVKVISIAEPEE